ncbi:MAG: phosphate ABC transporter permease PstA [bacterium]|nr:phosphate ABC transporter permease PstA [bacterium]
MKNEQAKSPSKSLRTRSRHATMKAFWAFCFQLLCLSALLICLGTLFLLVGSVLWQGASRVSWEFITSRDSYRPDKAGIKYSLVGSMLLMLWTSLFSVPIGVGAAIYLEEYSADSWWRRIVQINIANLAGVPSIVYGILGLGLFVSLFNLGESLLAGALTLSLVILPIVVLASQEALRGVPDSIRSASYALGATRWQTIWRQVLPAAAPGILTGVILALSRAIGEAAPLIAVGVALKVNFLASDPFTALLKGYAAMPLKIFNWADNPNPEFHRAAAAAIIVLLTVLIVLNGIAVCLRHFFSRNLKW